MTAWEYKTITIELGGMRGGVLKTTSLDQQLNVLGEQGWEAVSGWSNNYGGGGGREVNVLLKRARG